VDYIRVLLLSLYFIGQLGNSCIKHGAFERFVGDMPERTRYLFLFIQANGTNRFCWPPTDVDSGAGLHASTDSPDTAYTTFAEACIPYFLLQETYLLRHDGVIDSG